jgi:hypothetical protein
MGRILGNFWIEGLHRSNPIHAVPIVTLSQFPTPAPNKAFQPFWLGKAHETVGVLDDNLGNVSIKRFR